MSQTIEKAAQIGIQAVSGVATNALAMSQQETGSLISVAGATRVEPICVIDTAILHHEMIPEVMQVMQSMFAGFYLQAFNYLVNVGNVSPADALERLNPTRKISLSMQADSYEFTLPEAESDGTREAHLEDLGIRAATELGITDPKQMTSITDLSALSVGKIFNVDIADPVAGTKPGKGTPGTPSVPRKTITLSVRIMAQDADPDLIIAMFQGQNTREYTLKERWYAYRAGDIELIRDLILCRDMIKEYKKTLASDKHGLYQRVLARRRKNDVAGLLTGKFSLANLSNIAVVAKSTIDELEAKTGEKFSNKRFRDRVFEATYLMIVAVVDPMYERVTFYFQDIDGSTSVSRRDLKDLKKGDAMNVSDLLKAYDMGSAPRI